MLALIRLSDMFYLVVPKHFFSFFYFTYMPLGLFISPPKTPSEVI